MKKKEQKVFIDKKDSLESVVHRVINSEAERVILNIPRGSALGSSVSNFQILKRESEAVGKEFSIESVDDHILGLSGLAKIPAINPIFGDGGKIMADIMPISKARRKDIEENVGEDIEEKKVKVSEEKEEEEEEEEEKNEEETEESPEEEYEDEEESSFHERENLYDQEEEEVKRKWWKIPVTALILASLALLFYGAVFKWLPKASVAISLERVTVLIEEEVVVSPDFGVTGRGPEGKVAVAGEILTARRNSGEALFPATGRETVESRARGELIVVNAFSSASQPLVASTRFVSPEGKVFRLDRAVTVPGAQVVGGTVEPSQIRVSVTADEPGEEYNIGPSIRWRIPGFEGTPRYEGFYANAPERMEGGFVGEISVPTEEDVEQAREKVERSLEDSLRGQMNILLMEDFELFNEAQVFDVADYEVMNSDEEGKFILFMEGRLRYLLFRESDLNGFLTAQTKLNLEEGVRLERKDLSYDNVEMNWEDQELSFIVKGEMIFINDAFMEDFKESILGKRENELRRLVLVLPGIENASISLWPFWVKKVPTNPKKVEVTLR